ncbi:MULTISPECIES: MFS transporter [Paraburkholderia]|uniref:MFS transporter n=1 Tax=Paraburkholderia TaxID=1822464 RepID=UPI003218BA35
MSETSRELMPSIATRVIFFLAGTSVAAWAPLVPYAQNRLKVDDALLGFLLLCLGIGAVGCMPVCQRLVARYGCRPMVYSGAAMICIALPSLATVTDKVGMAIALLLFGAGLGFIDVSMNINAAQLEARTGRRLMSGFHGFFSVGGITGSLLGGTLLSVGVGPLGVAVAVVVAVVALVAAFARYIGSEGAQTGTKSALVLPQGVVVLMSGIALVSFLVEGAMLDWSAVYLTSVKSYDQDRAGFGYTAFSIAMTVGRLGGDHLVKHLGARLMITGGGIFAVLGLVASILFPTGNQAIFGFAITGLGCANIVPVLFAAAGRQKSMEPAQAISALTMLGYGGNLMGPAVVGFFSHALGLRMAFAILAALLLMAALVGRRIED